VDTRRAEDLFMRYAGSSHPEWGFLAPQPSFLRTTRLVMIAAAVGAIAGSAAVLGLVDRPAETSVAARTLVPSTSASPTVAAAPAPATNGAADARVSAQNLAQPPGLSATMNDSAVSEVPSQRSQQRLRGMATLVEVPAAAASTPAGELAPAAPAASTAATTEIAPTQKTETAPVQKKVFARRRRPRPTYAWRGDHQVSGRREYRQDSGRREVMSHRNLFDWAPRSEYSANDYRAYPREWHWGGYGGYDRSE
jgi:hypothetical protein